MMQKIENTFSMIVYFYVVMMLILFIGLMMYF